MKPGMKIYLKTVGIEAESMLERVEHVLELCSRLCGEEGEDIFVNDYIKEDGSRDYADLEIFAEGYIACARNFLTQDDISVYPFVGNLELLKFSCQGFDLKSAKAESRMLVRLAFVGKVNWEYKASGKNCEKLMEIIDKYYKAKLTSGI